MIHDYGWEYNSQEEQLMKNNRSVEQSRWIPCSERMPEIGEDVLVTLSIGHFLKGEIVVAYLIYDNCNKLLWLDYVHSEPYKTDEVLAWMPLPEPYKSESENESNKKPSTYDIEKFFLGV